MTEQTTNNETVDEKPTSEKFKHYRRIGLALFSALAVGLGVYLEAIPVSFITDMFAGK